MAKAKRLADLLRPCQEEEEVKAEFAKFFKIKYNTRHRIDLYTPQILFEFKYNQNFTNNIVKARAIAQTLYYVRRLKYGNILEPVPPIICVVNKNEGFFIPTTDYKTFYSAGAKYDWDRAPSQPCPKLVAALLNSSMMNKIHVYRFDVEAEESLFVNSVFLYLQDDSLLLAEKKTINEENFLAVYEHWAKFFEKYVKNGHKPSEYFVSDIEVGRSEKLEASNSVLFHLNDGTVSKSIPMKDYDYFWNIYEKNDRADVMFAIRQKMDRLSEDYLRRFTGEFYTPIEFADKAFDYILRTVGREKYKEKYVKNGHKPSEYFVSDIEVGRSEKLEASNSVLFHLNDGTVSKSIPMKDYDYFWNIYEKNDRADVMFAIRQKMDRLSEDYLRRFTGEFYTPIEFADKAFDYILRTVGREKYKNGKWRIWDMAAGTGNLEFMLPSSALQYCYISTLLEDDAAYCKRIFPTATVFQYDYLNDDAFLIDDIGKIPFGITPKMPKRLYNDLRDPEISWIIFINPPFATSNKNGNELGKKSKDDVSMTFIRQIMTKNGLGETSRELFSQFLYRISVEFNSKSAYLGLFSKLKYLNSNNDQKLRDKVFQYKFERGLMFSSENFHGNKGKFPVGFLVWNLGKCVPIGKQKIVLDVYNKYCEKIGTKEILTTERDSFLNRWPTREKNTSVFPALSSAIEVTKRTKDVRDRIADGFLCSLMCCGNDMQHYNYVAIFSGPQASAGSYSVTPNNFERSMILHAVRKLAKPSWDNDRDQFYQPFNEKISALFTSDCVVWSCFAPSNNTVSMKNVEYQGKVYQIENKMFPFLLKRVKTWPCGLSDFKLQIQTANEDRFMALWLQNHELSPEAENVLEKAECLYRCIFANLGQIRWLDYKIGLWDIGWWQVKAAAKDIDEAKPLFIDLKYSMDALGNKILPLLPTMGFIPPSVQPLD